MPTKAGFCYDDRCKKESSVAVNPSFSSQSSSESDLDGICSESDNFFSTDKSQKDGPQMLWKI